MRIFTLFFIQKKSILTLFLSQQPKNISLLKKNLKILIVKILL